MATDTLTAQPETAEWNPVEAVKSKYPDIGMQDHEIARTLQDPAKFRAAFPEYTGVTDDEIKTKVGKFVDSRPEYQSPVGGSGSELKAAGEGKMVTSFDPDATDTGVKYRGITKSLLPAGHVEKAAGEYAQAPSTLAESDNPTLTGLKKFGAGMVADTAKAGKDMFSSPLGIATLGLGPLAESVTELAPAAAELPVVGKYIRPAAQVVAKYAEPAVRWLGRIAGVGMAGLGGHEAYEGVKEGNTSKTLNGLSSVALGASGAFYPKGGTPEDHAFDAARARKQAKGALPTITVPKGVEPAPLEGQAEGLGNLPKTTADPAEVLNKLGPQAKPAAKTGEALAAVPQPKPAAALRSIPTPVERPVQESGEALASLPKPATTTPEALREVPTPAMRPVQESGEALAGLPLRNPLGSIKTPEAMRASESGEALATVPKSKSSELGAIATPKARPASETGEVLGERPVPDQPITPEVVAKAKALMQTSAPGEATKDTVKNEESPTNEIAKSADEFNKERGLPPVKPEKSEPNPSAPVASVNEELTDSEKRALAHRIGTVAANDMSPEGQDRASRFLRATQQQIADVANKLGPVKPGGGEWTAKDFSRSGAKGGNLNPNKQGVFLHLQNNVPHEELMKATEDWGPSSELVKKLKGKGPAPKATPVTARMSDEELKEHGFTQADIDAGKHFPPITGGSAAVSALAKTKGIPEEISKHEDLGVNLGQLDDRLKAAGEKPEVSGRTTATTSRSVGKLKERIEEARGRGAIPPPKSAQGELSFREPHPARSSDADTEFNSEKLGEDLSPLYHGAPAESVDDILKNGLSSDEGRIYATPDREEAIKYGKAKSASGKGVALQVNSEDFPDFGYHGLEKRSRGSIDASRIKLESSTPLTDTMMDKYGNKGKPLSTAFLKPDGTRIPVTDHDVALEKVSGIKGGEESRQKYINDEKVIRQRFRTGREGKEIVFSVPDKVTPEQITSLKESVKELGTSGVLSIERAQKSGPYFRTYNPTESSVELGLQDIGVLSKEKATTEYSGPLQEDTAEASARSTWRMQQHDTGRKTPLGRIKSTRGGAR